MDSQHLVSVGEPGQSGTLKMAMHTFLAFVLSRLQDPSKPWPEVATPSQLPCKEPITRAPVNFPSQYLVGFEPVVDFVMESGYINVTAEDYLFYWFTGATSAAPADAPVLIWSNGGPGCSAMEGATTEGGPMWLWDAKASAKTGFSGTLSRNAYAFNNQVHSIFVDQPRYVGYSTGTGRKVTSSVAAGKDLVQFILGWYRAFPEHAHRKLILASESYGGHYVPAWANAVLDYNMGRPTAEQIPLKALLIGNGIVNGTVQGGSFGEYTKAQKLIPDGVPTPTSDGAARTLMAKTLGYSPNFYDYRLVDQECCGCTSYNYKEWSDWFLRDEVKEALNVCGTAGQEAFGGCAAGCVGLPTFDDHDTFSYSGSLSRALEEGIDVTFYYGKQDTACNWVGALEMANTSLVWGGSTKWANTPFAPLKVGHAITGSVRSASGPNGAKLSFYAIDGAGHMVPMDNAAAASEALSSIV